MILEGADMNLTDQCLIEMDSIISEWLNQDPQLFSNQEASFSDDMKLKMEKKSRIIEEILEEIPRTSLDDSLMMTFVLQKIKNMLLLPECLVFVGPQSSGKSILASKLINQDLPSSDEGTTGKITKLFYSETPVIRKIRSGHWDEYGLYIQYNEPLVAEIYPEELTEDILEENICSVIQEEDVQIPSQENGPSEYMDSYRKYKDSMKEMSTVVEIGIPSDLLKHGLTFIDCPGFDGPKTAMMTMKKLKEQNPSIIGYVYKNKIGLILKDGETLCNLIREIGSSLDYIVIANIFEPESGSPYDTVEKEYFYEDQERETLFEYLRQNNMENAVENDSPIAYNVLNHLQKKILNQTLIRQPTEIVDMNCITKGSVNLNLLKHLIIEITSVDGWIKFPINYLKLYIYDKCEKDRFSRFSCWLLSLYIEILSGLWNELMTEQEEIALPIMQSIRRNLEKIEVNIKSKFICGYIYFKYEIVSHPVLNDIFLRKMNHFENRRIKYSEYLSSINQSRIDCVHYFKISPFATKIQTLHDAVENKNEFFVAVALYFGESVDSRDSNKDSPLHIACFHGYEKIVNLLLAQGADIYIRNNMEMTPLHLACKQGHENIVVIFLIECGHTTKSIELVSQCLHSASEMGYERIVNHLLDFGADKEALDTEGNTPLIVACQNGQEIVAECLLKRQANIDAQNFTQNSSLHLSSEIGNENLVYLLIDRGAEINLVNEEGNTPLYCAYMKGHENIVMTLHNNGADIFVENNMGMTLL